MMQPIEIVVKKIYKNQGKTKAGGDYILTKLLSQDKRYFSTFLSSSVIASIQEGSKVKLEAVQSKEYPTNYDITRIIQVDAAPNDITRNSQAGRPLTSDSSIHNQTPSPLPLSASDALKMLTKAIAEVQKELPQVDDDALIPLMAVHYGAALQAQQQRFSLDMSNMVQQSKLRNMGMIK